MRVDGLTGDRLAFVRLRLAEGRMSMQIGSLREQEIDRPQLFDVAQNDALVSLYLCLGNVIFLSGSDALAGFLNRPFDLARLVELRQQVSVERMDRRAAYQQRAIGPCERSLVSYHDAWLDLCPPGDDGYHVIGMDEYRRRVFAFRSAPSDRVAKHQLCYATISVADRPIEWLTLSISPDAGSSFVDASRFVRVMHDGESVGVQSIVRLKTARGIDEQRLVTIEESDNGPVARWSDPFSADYSVLGPDWRTRTAEARPSDLPSALLLQERAAGGYAIHRLSKESLVPQQLYAYLVNAGSR